MHQFRQKKIHQITNSNVHVLLIFRVNAVFLSVFLHPFFGYVRVFDEEAPSFQQQMPLYTSQIGFFTMIT